MYGLPFMRITAECPGVVIAFSIFEFDHAYFIFPLSLQQPDLLYLRPAFQMPVIFYESNFLIKFTIDIFQLCLFFSVGKVTIIVGKGVGFTKDRMVVIIT